MTKLTRRIEKPQCLTARFPHSEYSEIVEEAEIHGSTKSDVLRQAWKSYRNNLGIERTLKTMEARLIKNMFEICACTLGLSEQERTDALHELKQNLTVGAESEK